MKYYIQSAGKNKKHEYTWIHLGSDNSSSKPESILNNIKHQGVDIESCFLIIARDEDEKGHDEYLFLLIKLESKHTDYQNRKILNYIAVKSENDEDDRLIQALSSVLLVDSEVKAKISSLIKLDNDSLGFKINESEFIKKLKTFADSETREAKTDHQTYFGKIAKDSKDKRIELAEKIITQFPGKNKGILVLVSDSTPLETINQIKSLFRGLIGKSAPDDWEDTLCGKANKAIQDLQEFHNNAKLLFYDYKNDNNNLFIDSDEHMELKKHLKSLQKLFNREEKNKKQNTQSSQHNPTIKSGVKNIKSGVKGIVESLNTKQNTQ